MSLSLRGRFSDQIVVQTVYSDESNSLSSYMLSLTAVCLVFVHTLFWSIHSFLLNFLYLGICFGDEEV